jgi:hypothetical protein
MLLNAPGYLFSVPGGVLSLVGLVIMAVAYSGVEIGGVGIGIHSMIAGSLLTLVGTQVGSLGVFATVASDPIRRPDDPITEGLLERVRLEHGATAGVLLFGAGAAYTAFLFGGWVSSGFSRLPLLMADIAAFTVIVLGIQLVFGSFFLSAIAERT